MCLNSIKKDPHIVKRDRRCWKVLFLNEAGMLFSMVLHKEYELGKLYTEECEPQVEIDETTNGKPTFNVYGGYMHAFSSFKRAMLEYEYYSHTKDWSPVVCECTIPAGTEVYTDGKCHEICTRALRVDRIVNKFKKNYKN